jgi:hypothetical protein
MLSNKDSHNEALLALMSVVLLFVHAVFVHSCVYGLCKGGTYQFTF